MLSDEELRELEAKVGAMTKDRAFAERQHGRRLHRIRDRVHDTIWFTVYGPAFDLDATGLVALANAAPALLAAARERNALAAAADARTPVFQCGECGGYVASREPSAPCPHCRISALETAMGEACDLIDSGSACCSDCYRTASTLRAPLSTPETGGSRG